MIELLEYDFMRNALAAAVLVSLICGILGPVSVIRRTIMTTGGIAHGAYGGLGLAWFMGWPPRLGVYGAALLLACAATWMSRKAPKRADSVMGILWAVGMATGILFTDMTPGYGTELTSYLFGSIMTVSTRDLVLMGAIASAAAGMMFFHYPSVEAFLFDEVFASTRGVPVAALDWVVTVLTSLAVVSVIRVVGLIMVIALFTMPPFLAERGSRSLGSMMVRSSALALFFCVFGLWLSAAFDFTAGAAIVAVGGVTCLVVFLARGALRRPL